MQPDGWEVEKLGRNSKQLDNNFGTIGKRGTSVMRAVVHLFDAAAGISSPGKGRLLPRRQIRGGRRDIASPPQVGHIIRKRYFSGFARI
jgi:hypothetical protein